MAQCFLIPSPDIMRIHGTKKNLRDGSRKSKGEKGGTMRKRGAILFVLCIAATIIVILPMRADCSRQEPEHISIPRVEFESIEAIRQESVQEISHEKNVYKPIDEIPLDADLQEYMQELCEDNNLSFAFALMIMESESRYDPAAVGDNGESVGLFQINRVNWERMAEEYGYDVHDVKGNIGSGVAILTELFVKYDDPYRVILCYKCGESRGNDLFAQGVYKTVQFDCRELCERAQEIEGLIYE